jgi:hypothetical protein
LAYAYAGSNPASSTTLGIWARDLLIGALLAGFFVGGLYWWALLVGFIGVFPLSFAGVVQW